MTKIKKLCLIGAILTISVFFSSNVEAITMTELQAQIVQLQAQIVQLQAQLAAAQGEEAALSHAFNFNLKYGNSGAEIEALHLALEKQGFNIVSTEKNSKNFGDSTLAAVIGFQERYTAETLAPWGLQKGTGFVGSTTRKKLNSLYGGTLSVSSVPVIPPVPSAPLVPSWVDVYFSPRIYSIDEDAGSVTVWVKLSATTTYMVSVDYYTSDHTATAYNDYYPASGTLVFNAGERFKSFDVEIINDDLQEEPIEWIKLNLHNPVRANIKDYGIGWIKIIDDELVDVYFDLVSYSVNEGSATTAIMVRLSTSTLNTVTVDYYTSDGTATADEDYYAASGTLTFYPGQKYGAFEVAIIDDNELEDDETVNLTLHNPVNADLGNPNTAVLTIIDDDEAIFPDVYFSSESYSVNEGGPTVSSLSNLTSAKITVLRSTAPTEIISVDYYTSDGTATVYSDYQPASGTLTFYSGQYSKSFYVWIVNDDLYESDETVNLTLHNPVNANLGSPSTAVLTIIDDDEQGTTSIESTDSNLELRSGLRDMKKQLADIVEAISRIIEAIK